MISVFLVDDHAVVRRGLASYLAGEDDMIVVGQAANGRQALDELAVLDRAGSLPDVVLADLLMPELDGVGLIAELSRRWPWVRAIAVTSFLEEAKIRAALEARAGGHLLKDAEAERTARAHVSNILAKLGLTSRTQAAVWARDHGIGPDPGAPA